jgi:DNA polymerase-3 subunit delta
LPTEAGFNWEQLYVLLNSSSLMAEKCLLELDFRDMLPNKTAATILQEYGNKPVPDKLLLIDIGKLDTKITKSNWYQSLERSGIVITIWPIPHEQLPQWIINRAKKYKLQFNFDAASLLSDYVEGNLIAAAQAIEKVYLLQPQNAIDISLIKTLLTDESRFTIFDFIESLIAGDNARTLHILESLKNEGTEPVLILWGITRELRFLADLAHQLKQGASWENIWQKQRIFSRRQAGIRHFSTKHSLENCWQYLTHAAEIDRIIKGAAIGDVWEALQLFCLRLASQPVV